MLWISSWDLWWAALYCAGSLPFSGVNSSGWWLGRWDSALAPSLWGSAEFSILVVPVTGETLLTIIYTLATFQIDYCNEWDCHWKGFWSFSWYKIPPKEVHVIPVLCKLCYLPVSFQVQFKLLVLTFEILHGIGWGTTFTQLHLPVPLGSAEVCYRSCLQRNWQEMDIFFFLWLLPCGISFFPRWHWPHPWHPFGGPSKLCQLCYQAWRFQKVVN